MLAPGLLTLFLERRHGDLGAQLRKLELPVLGTVPEITPDAGLERLSSGGRARAAGGGGFQNTLRINLEHLLPEKGRSRVLLFTGANRKAGTSTVISAAALALAENGGKVLLVDGNLRKPDIHRIFHLDNSTGLTDLLNGDRGFDALVHRNAGVPGLDVLTGGTAPGASGELLNSPRLEELLRAEAPHYRYILVDSPAAPGIADPVILGKLADAALLVGDCRKAGVAGLRALSARLLQAGVPCGGVILNYFRRRRSGVPGADGEYDYHYRFRRIADD